MEKVDNREKLLAELDESKESAINAIQDFAGELIKMVKTLEMESIQEVERAFCEIQSLLEQEIADAEYEIMRTNNTVQTLEENKGESFHNDFTTTDTVTSIENMIQFIGRTASTAKIVFSEDIYIRDALSQIESLGSVITTKSRTHAYTALSSKDVNIRLSSDTGTCNITDSCLAGPRMLLLVDNSNKSLKRLHSSQMSVIDYCGLSAHPYCVCLTSSQEAVVSLSNNSLQFVSLGNTMSRTRLLNLNHCCYGIACKGDKLYVTDSSCSLYIYDMSGEQLQVVSQDNLGNNLFQYSRQLNISHTGNELFVTDWTNKLIVLDVDGKYISSCNDTTIEQANGIETDGRGNVFVSGYASRNIVQFGPDGKRKGIITKASENLIDHPYSICFVPGQSLLFVSQGNSDRLKVFALK